MTDKTRIAASAPNDCNAGVRARQAWTRPTLMRLNAAAAELGPNTPSPDGAFSKS